MGALLLMGIVTSCNEEKKEEVVVVNEQPGINLKDMDTTVKPSEDFYRYANGAWLDSTEIPGDRSSWGSIHELGKKTDNDALDILKSAISEDKDLKGINLVPGSDQEKAVLLYQTIMDTISRNQQGIEPLKPTLARIDGIQNVKDLQTYMIEMESKGASSFFGFGVGPDAKNSSINVGQLGAGSLGLPERDYYIKDDEKAKEIRAKYVEHITKMLQFLGEDEAKANAQAKNILAFETKLAEPRMDKVEMRDPLKRYNPKSVSELKQMVPIIDWDAYLDGIGVKQIDTVIVVDPGYMKAVQKILAQNNISDWKSYLKWHELNSAASKLSTEIDTQNWNFYSKELNGTKEQRPLDERALQTINWTLGEALGKLYVDQKFPPEAKAKAEKMIANVIKAYENRISKLEWMGDDTKKKAIEKLKSTTIKIAYPDQWKDYSELVVKSTEDGGSYLQNMQNAAEWNFKDDISKIGKEVDKSEWFMAPQIVNAYYYPPNNEIVFPAAILQPPFYNYLADDAVNYGGIGAVIGHEISHSFDDQGSKYDKEGNLNNWWTEEDLTQFRALGNLLATQFDDLEVLPEVNVDGKFTLGENIGDLGGINAAYDALQMSLKDSGEPEKIDGLTAEQRFFISWATVWRTLSTDDALGTQVKTDPHSPGMFRAVQPLRNIDAFYSAFNIKEGDPLYLAPENRVHIW